MIGRSGTKAPKFPKRLHAVHFRHRKIEQYEVDWPRGRPQSIHGDETVLRDKHFAAEAFQRAADCATHGFFVVHDEDCPLQQWQGFRSIQNRPFHREVHQLPESHLECRTVTERTREP
jgi:hypothetical protein